MTRDQVLARVRLNLNDVGITFWSSSDANDSIQDGYDDVAINSGCIEKTIPLTPVVNLLYYNLSSTISDYFKLSAIFNPSNNYWLTPVALEVLRQYGPEFEKATGPPTHFCPISFEYTILWPASLVATPNLTLIYAAQANILSATTVPTIPTEFQNILEDYVTADLLEQAEEYVKAGTYWQSYSEKRKRLKYFMLAKMQERIMTLKANVG